MSVHVQVEHALMNFQLSVTLDAGAGLTALIGASGAGKTMLLNIVAGIVRPDRGRVTIDGDVLVDTARGIWRPMHTRRIGYVFQAPRLFPHLTVRRNLAYGRWFAPHGRDGLSFDDVVSLLDLDALLGRMPGRLSGGEAQRVALGRALLSQPRVLLLDEPLASVDQARRDEVLPYLDRVRQERHLPTIYVTHTHAEIASRAEHIVVLDRGRVA